MDKKEKKYGLFKVIAVMVLISIILTWLIPVGVLDATGYTQYRMYRFGLNDLPQLFYVAFEFCWDKLVLLLAIGGFYGVLSGTNAYERIVSGIANKLKNKKVTVVVCSIVLALLGSMLTQDIMLLIFIPFIISILSRMKIDKVTILMATFGSVIIGLMGSLYGAESLGEVIAAFASTASDYRTLLSATLLPRVGILVSGLALYDYLMLRHMKNAKDGETADMFLTEYPENEKKKKTIIPIVVLGIVLLVLLILGYIDWETNFNFTAFSDFNTYLGTLNIKTSGEEFNLITSLLGSDFGALGKWNIFEISGIMMLFTGVLVLCYRMKVDQFIHNLVRGIKVMLVPMVVVLAVNFFMLVPNLISTPYTTTILNFFLKMSDGFNLATFTLVGIIANTLNTYVPYTIHILGTFVASQYADYTNVIVVILTSLYGFVQMFMPTSILLGIGLVSLKIRYADWLKKIWRFVLGMLIILLVIFILMTII